MRYAAKTKVSAEKSRNEIEATLKKYKATAFSFGYQQTMAAISFEMNSRRIAFFLPLPQREKFGSQTAWEQATRQRWRALTLSIKAKLEAVDSGIALFEEEFLANIVIPTTGKTIGHHMVPQIAKSYTDGKMPPLLGYTT